jgi:CHRD domain
MPGRILLTASFIWPAGYLLPDLLAGPTYIDVHTRANPRGELRGQLTVERIS